MGSLYCAVSKKSYRDQVERLAGEVKDDLQQSEVDRREVVDCERKIKE